LSVCIMCVFWKGRPLMDPEDYKSDVQLDSNRDRISSLYREATPVT
jgi:hypothetical protein